MRPEAWVLAGLYWLYLWPVSDWNRADPARRRSSRSRRVLWAALDWYVTGDPLHSLHGTADLAEAVDRRREPEQAPYWTLQYFGYVLREPIVVGFPIGLYFAWRFRLRAAVLPLAVAGGDDGRVHDRPGLRAAADRPLRAHARRAARAVLRARGVRLAAAGPGPHAADLDVGRDRDGGALDRVPAVARRHARRHARQPRRARARLRAAARRRPRAGRRRDGRALRRAR